MTRPIPVVDLFAGPGGLGEGFASLGGTYRIIVSVEKEPYAHRTLRLRAFKRLLDGNSLSDQRYYDYVTSAVSEPYDRRTRDLWQQACREAQCLTLGEPDAEQTLRALLESSGIVGNDWVLVGGPPCQAYSVVGRSRNRGIASYVAAQDPRHYLYREYLKIIQEFRPSVFIMENVKGLLSSTVGGRRMFDSILKDLVDPDNALRRPSKGGGYRIHSLTDSSAVFSCGDDPSGLRGDEFTICSENFGVPQARHRIILLGIRDDCCINPPLLRHFPYSARTVAHAISDLPPVRSRLSRRSDSATEWTRVIVEQATLLARQAEERGWSALAERLVTVARTRLRNPPPPSGGFQKFPQTSSPRVMSGMDHELLSWYRDPKLPLVLNHDARSHMASDLGRYLYAACFAACYRLSPKSRDHFDFPTLMPRHRSWQSGHFADRFRVQLWEQPGKTVTSHIHKDGHYFIHPDPAQCRSFTVREAARIQTFPDNYFFEGNRTQQYIQVGNAVPPLLARRIAEVVSAVIHVDRDNRDECMIRQEVG